MDEALDTTLKSASRGDQEAWRRLIDAFAPRVFALLRSQCGDGELAEEVTQSVFCTLAAKLTGDRGYVEQGKFEAWVFRIAINRLRDEMRRRRRYARTCLDAALDGGATPPGEANAIPSEDQGDEERKSLREAIARLSPADRQIIEYRYVGGLSFRQMADLLDEPLGTVLARQHRALRKLRDILEDVQSIPSEEDGGAKEH